MILLEFKGRFMYCEDLEVLIDSGAKGLLFKHCMNKDYERSKEFIYFGDKAVNDTNELFIKTAEKVRGLVLGYIYTRRCFSDREGVVIAGQFNRSLSLKRLYNELREGEIKGLKND